MNLARSILTLLALAVTTFASAQSAPQYIPTTDAVPHGSARRCHRPLPHGPEQQVSITHLNS